jgi:hypothetical protein
LRQRFQARNAVEFFIVADQLNAMFLCESFDFCVLVRNAVYNSRGLTEKAAAALAVETISFVEHIFVLPMWSNHFNRMPRLQPIDQGAGKLLPYF